MDVVLAHWARRQQERPDDEYRTGIKSVGRIGQMIRYYEQSGLIARADRTASGYRDYSEADVHVLRFIRRARDLGFSVSDIAELLGLWRDDTRQSAEVKRLAQGHIKELKHKIRALQDMTQTLTTLVNACQGDHRPQCPIIERLETDDLDEDVSLEPRRGALSSLGVVNPRRSSSRQN